jgi:urease accessory protein
LNPSRSRCGRDGLLRLGFERSAETHPTTLRHCRYTLPLQVLSPLTLDDGTCYLLLLNPTGGVLGGDRLRTEISLAENSAACLSTPSATRIYRTNGHAAEMQTVVQVASNATLEYLPDHLILHAGSALRQTLRIEMQPRSRGIFIDAFAAGRVAQDESWRFREFDSRTEVNLDGKLIYAARTKISGAVTAGDVLHHSAATTAGVATPAPLQGPDHQPLGTSHSSLPPYCASLLIIADRFPDWRPVVANLRAQIDSVPDLLGGASPLSESGCSARYWANSAIALQEATRRLWTAARCQVLNLPPLDLRKY